MKARHGKSSWIAFALFYLVLLIIVSILDLVNGVLTLSYWGMQAALITIGVGILAVLGIRAPDLSATRGVLLAFTVGILTIIPAVLMGLGKIPGFWPQYFSIAFGIATGSLLTSLFLKFVGNTAKEEESNLEIDSFD